MQDLPDAPYIVQVGDFEIRYYEVLHLVSAQKRVVVSKDTHIRREAECLEIIEYSSEGPSDVGPIEESVFYIGDMND